MATYVAEALQRTRSQVRWNYSRGNIWPGPATGVPLPDTDEETLKRITASLKRRVPTIPEEVLAALKPAAYPGAEGPAGAPGIRYLAEPVTYTVGIGAAFTGTSYYLLAHGSGYGILSSVTIELGSETGPGNYSAVGLFLVPEYLDADPVADPVTRGDGMPLTQDADGTGYITMGYFHDLNTGFVTTLPFEKQIPFAPWSIILSLAGIVGGGALGGFCHTVITPSIPQPISVRVPSPIILTQRTLLVAPLPAPARVSTTPSTSYPRGVKVKVMKDNMTIMSQDIAWASLDVELKKRFLNAQLSGKPEPTLEGIW